MLKGLKVKITMRGVGKKGIANQEWHMKIKYDNTTFKTTVENIDDFDEKFFKKLEHTFGKKNAKKIFKTICKMLEDC